ncbi:dimethyladenosine transferase [Desulfonispora thiosulfatigenes DSM 11270]|uniref:Ribosomal RNA small subunit methyltransferase A n=1 Tax=Desulfonispora thiosulfatigenes DSM 11270 TaxID=656914 RepID=A0A1W1V0I5_DESTI|nr:16S rRNA (adenine(1518)-N(6)/adenine(1519)-N(6))-dimethyltransferase RsmA [Desulfonispora thiosulfatigenes]SMB86842.1 dimethyladenosine transferase [Desulfonispora thiosulfatigenes DSM 11270]
MQLKELLNKHKFRFKKRFGQNFISDPGILDKIARSADIDSEDIIVEIGPGAGTLTRVLAKGAKRVIAIEIDKDLIPVLEESLADLENVTVIQGDALKVDLDQLVYDELGKKIKYKIVANLPYYITTPLIMHFLESEFNIERIIIMVQKEVAERLKANPGTKEYGAITVGVNLMAEVSLSFIVPRHIFIPAPEVDSAIIDLKVRDQSPFVVNDNKVFRKLVRAAFNQRRKTLANALKVLGVEKEKIENILLSCDIDPKRRGETLSLEEFARVSNKLIEIEQ